MLGGIFEGVALSSIVTIVSLLGLPGLVLIFWYVDQRRYEKQREEHKEELVAIMAKYEKDMATVTRFYEDNVLLVKGYDRLAGDLSNIIALNTQGLTRLVEKIENNMHCPVVREGGLKAWGLTQKD